MKLKNISKIGCLFVFGLVSLKANARPVENSALRAKASNELGPHKIDSNGKAQPLVYASRLIHSKQTKRSMNDVARQVISGIEGKSALLKGGERDGKSSFFLFTRSKWDVAFDSTASRGWGRMRGAEESSLKAANRNLSDEELVHMAKKSVAKLFPFIAQDASRGFDFEVSQIGSTSISKESVLTNELVEERQVSHLVRIRRTYKGVSFMGPGSVMTLEYNLSGILIGYWFDWSPLKIDEAEVELVDYQGINERLARKESSRFSMSAAKSDLRCGYHDSGSYGRKKKPVVEVSCQRTVDFPVTIGEGKDQAQGTSRHGVLVSASAEE